jgi:short-subunit dehydrogenase
MRFRTAVVTGASSGLGEEFARRLAGRCGTLVLVARRIGRLERLAAELHAAAPEMGVEAVAADLSVPGERLRLLEGLLKRGLIPDLLINNAGLGDFGEFADADWGRTEAMLKVNIEALTHLAHALLPGMLSEGRGAVVNVSSLASLVPIPDIAVYAATKAYVTSFSEALRLEVRGRGVRVLAVCPGPVRTEFGRVASRGGTPATEPPVRGWFYVGKEQVVDDAFAALARDRARVFPGWKIAAAAALAGALPMVAIRAVMGRRPRRGK